MIAALLVVAEFLAVVYYVVGLYTRNAWLVGIAGSVIVLSPAARSVLRAHTPTEGA